MQKLVMAMAVAALVGGCATTGQLTPELRLAPHHKHHNQVRHHQAQPAPVYAPPIAPVQEAWAEDKPERKLMIAPGFIGYRGKHVRWFIDRRHHRAGFRVQR